MCEMEELYHRKIKKMVDEKDKEIERLQDKILKLETDASIYKDLSNLRQERIDEAIGYIKNNCYIETTNEYMKYGDDLSPKYLIDILQGSDKE